MDLEKLQTIGVDPFWREAPVTTGVYCYPIPSVEDDSLYEAGLAMARDENISPKYLWRDGCFLFETDPRTHCGPFYWFVDIRVPYGSAVLAPADGIVIGYDDSHTRGGNDPEFLGDLNWLKLQCAFGEIVWFGHLAAHSVHEVGLWRGSRVEAGDVLGHTGKTGFLTGPHLHFGVTVRSLEAEKKLGPDFGFRSLKVRFQEAP